MSCGANSGRSLSFCLSSLIAMVSSMQGISQTSTNEATNMGKGKKVASNVRWAR
jgi:hypothetical protein